MIKIENIKRKKINLPWWLIFRTIGVFASLYLLISVNNSQRYYKKYCGTVVEKKDWAREGSKGRVYEGEYIIMKWEDTGELKRIDVTSETFFELKIGSKTCFNLLYVTPNYELYFFPSLLLFVCFLVWWIMMGFERVDE